MIKCRFQELKEDPTAELKKLLYYLKVEVDPGRLHCIEKHSEGKFHRGKQESVDPFSEELKTLLDRYILTADSSLREKTGRGLPLEKYQYFNTSSS